MRILAKIMKNILRKYNFGSKDVVSVCRNLSIKEILSRLKQALNIARMGILFHFKLLNYREISSHGIVQIYSCGFFWVKQLPVNFNPSTHTFLFCCVLNHVPGYVWKDGRKWEKNSQLSPFWWFWLTIDSLQLCSGDTWIDSVTVEMNPMDAGTDNGFTFTAPNWPTEPQGVIYRITARYPAHPAGSFFYPQSPRLPPIGTFQFIKVSSFYICLSFFFNS